MTNILSNVTVQYNNLIEPQTQWEPHKWSVTLGPLTDDQVAQLEGEGLGHRIAYDKEFSPSINMGQKVTNSKTGATNKQPDFVDRDGTTPFTQDLGRGSVANIMYFTYESSFNGKTEVILEGVQVVEFQENENTPVKFEELT